MRVFFQGIEPGLNLSIEPRLHVAVASLVGEPGLLIGGDPARHLAVAAAREARRRAGTRPVAYYGESLGCAVALETALRLPPALAEEAQPEGTTR